MELKACCFLNTLVLYYDGAVRRLGIGLWGGDKVYTGHRHVQACAKRWPPLWEVPGSQDLVCMFGGQ